MGWGWGWGWYKVVKGGHYREIWFYFDLQAEKNMFTCFPWRLFTYNAIMWLKKGGCFFVLFFLQNNITVCVCVFERARVRVYICACVVLYALVNICCGADEAYFKTMLTRSMSVGQHDHYALTSLTGANIKKQMVYQTTFFCSGRKNKNMYDSRRWNFGTISRWKTWLKL